MKADNVDGYRGIGLLVVGRVKWAMLDMEFLCAAVGSGLAPAGPPVAPP